MSTHVKFSATATGDAITAISTTVKVAKMLMSKSTY